MCCVTNCDMASPSIVEVLKDLKCATTDESSSLKTKVTDYIQTLVSQISTLIQSSTAQEILNTKIKTSITDCQAIEAGNLLTIPDAPDEPSTDVAAYMGIGGLVFVFMAFTGFAFLVPVHFRRRDQLMKRALLDAHEHGASGKSKTEFELAERRLKAAFEHPTIPKQWRYGLICWLFVNVIFFVTANFAAPGATVEIAITIAGDTTQPIDLLEFRLANSINDMWNGNAVPLSLIIFLASGAWPYSKQILMLFCWCAPATILHPDRRGHYLEILDILGKWSLIDIYVLVLLIVAFHFYLSTAANSQFSFLPSDVLIVTVNVVPGWGIFGFIFGAFGSLLANHAMIYWHRRAMRSDEDLADEIQGTLVKDVVTPRIPLMHHRFNILDAVGRPYHYGIAPRLFLLAMTLSSIVLIFAGSAVNAIEFNFTGLAGLAMGLIDPKASSRQTGLFDITAGLLAGVAPDAAAILGTVWLQIIFISFAFVIPIFTLVGLSVLWAVPLTLKEQLRLEFFCEIFFAWEALAVLCFSFLAATLQIAQLAQFIVNSATGTICDQLALYAPLQSLFQTNPENGQCINVQAVIVSSGALIFIAAAWSVVTEAVAFRWIRAAVRDRELAMRRHAPISPDEMGGLEGWLVRLALEPFGPAQVGNAPGGNLMNDFAQQHAFGVPPAQPVVRNRSFGSRAPNPVMDREQRSIAVSSAFPDGGSVSAGNPLYSASYASAGNAGGGKSLASSVKSDARGPKSSQISHASIDV